MNRNTHVTRFQLSNGLDVLVYPYPIIPWVSTQLWYRVGSKHEHDGIRGAAHLLEHMLFKGTNRMSELDVTAITDALSGYTNAFTSHDYTAYIFDFPRQNWIVGLDLLADCMLHATIKPDLLNAELAVVMQELRLYNDDYESTLEEYLTQDIFVGHPYHYPVIGYRRDLWAMTSDVLLKFYKQWYMPNNAVLVIVGDVVVQDVYQEVERFFASIPAGTLPSSSINSLWIPDMITRSVDMKCDIHQLYDVTAFVIPGFKHGKHELATILGKLLADGIGSRLYKKLILGNKRAVSLEVDTADLDEYDLFFLKVHHKQESDSGFIRKAIQEELDDLASQGPTRAELTRSYTMGCMEYQELFEDMQELATAIGHGFVSTGDAQYGLRKPNIHYEQLADSIKQYVQQWCRPSQAQYGSLHRITNTDQQLWCIYQNNKDAYDKECLTRRERETPLEQLRYTNHIKPTNSDSFSFLSCTEYELAHKSRLITCITKTTQTVAIIVTFPISHENEPEDKAGIAEVTARLLIDSIKGLSSDDFADLIERQGIDLESGAGYIALSLLNSKWEYGLQLLGDIITCPTFSEDSFNRIRMHCMAELDALSDDSYLSIDQYARQAVYGKHPCGRLSLGNKESLSRLTIADVYAWYTYAYQIYDTTIAIVGDCDEARIVSYIDALWRTLSGMVHAVPLITPLELPFDKRPHVYLVSRDETAICYAGLSVSRMSEWYDALLLLDHIVCGGELGSMYSLLFQVRERTGLFYTVQGSTLFHAGIYPGMVHIKMLVSPDKIEKIDVEIKKMLRTVPTYITAQTISRARSGIVSARMQKFLSNKNLAVFFSFLARCGISYEEELHISERLANVSADRICTAAHRFLNPDDLVRITVGR